ncbi:MAG: conjugal transfer protein TraD [Stutzerimonas stutzeri]|nr:MAG: conjugal transfer protein TraD [Stutzerimonas stutzeri]
MELGGLIAKAGLRYEKRAVLLGALIELGRRLKNDETERARLAAIGAEAFGRDGE